MRNFAHYFAKLFRLNGSLHCFGRIVGGCLCVCNKCVRFLPVLMPAISAQNSQIIVIGSLVVFLCLPECTVLDRLYPFKRRAEWAEMQVGWLRMCTVLSSHTHAPKQTHTRAMSTTFALFVRVPQIRLAELYAVCALLNRVNITCMRPTRWSGATFSRRFCVCAYKP